jgi:hypothetical protein
MTIAVILTLSKAEGKALYVAVAYSYRISVACS